MDDPFKNPYRQMKIPDTLSSAVEEAIQYGLLTKRRASFGAAKKIISCAAVFFIVFVTLLNTNQVFAATLHDIPVVGDICRVFTFREYHFQDRMKCVDVKIPQINNTGKSALEKRVNLEISRLINKEVEKSEARAEEYYQAFIDTGGKPEEFMQFEIIVDYEIKCIDPSKVSFVITKCETSASAYVEQYFYNMDLQTGKLFALRDWFGSDYKKIVSDDIRKTISSWSEEQKSVLLDDVNIADLIDENRGFYLNDKNEIVVVFEKYEVAVGAAGILEFTIHAHASSA